jgi:hypothetical protein
MGRPTPRRLGDSESGSNGAAKQNDRSGTQRSALQYRKIADFSHLVACRQLRDWPRVGDHSTRLDTTCRWAAQYVIGNTAQSKCLDKDRQSWHSWRGGLAPPQGNFPVSGNRASDHEGHRGSLVRPGRGPYQFAASCRESWTFGSHVSRASTAIAARCSRAGSLERAGQ